MTRTVGVIVRDPAKTTAEDARPVAFAGSVDGLARALDGHAAAGFDETIVWLEPKTERSLDRLAEAVGRHRGER
jgi:hypothetical protein